MGGDFESSTAGTGSAETNGFATTVLSRIKLYAPIRLEIGFDCTYFSHGSDAQRTNCLAQFSELVGALSATESGYDWSGPQDTVSGSGQMLAFHNGRAPSERPFFVVAFAPRDLSALGEAEMRSGLPVRASRVRCLIHDFGIAVVEYDFTLEESYVPDACDYGDKVTALIDFVTSAHIPIILAGCDRLVAEAERRGMAAAPLYRIREVESADNNEHPGCKLYWFHGFSQFCADAASQPALSAWRESYMANGFAPRSGHAIDSVISLRVASYLPLHGRGFDADLVIGWGSSLSITTDTVGCAAIEKAVPLEIAFNLAQAFSALLYSLNKRSLEISSLFMRERDGFTQGRTKVLLETLASIQSKLGASTALLNEQRYCLTAAEQKIWDAAFEEWGNRRLIGDVRANLADLRTMLADHDREIQDARTRRLTFAAFLVTMSSASAVIFSMLPNFLLSQDPSRFELWLQVATISVLIVSALLLSYLSLRKKKARRP